MTKMFVLYTTVDYENCFNTIGVYTQEETAKLWEAEMEKIPYKERDSWENVCYDEVELNQPPDEIIKRNGEFKNDPCQEQILKIIGQKLIEARK